jgi:hypothetical protein
MFTHPSEIFCTQGKPRPDAPDTPILQLAKERGWRVFSYADDGTGEVEIAPDTFIELANAKCDEEDQDDYTVAVRFHVKNLPGSSRSLTDNMAVALQAVAAKLAGSE